MADYYNKQRAPMTLSLNNGKVIVMPTKAWSYIPPEDEGSSSVLQALRKGYIVRAAVPLTVVEKPAEEVALSPPSDVVEKGAEEGPASSEPVVESQSDKRKKR